MKACCVCKRTLPLDAFLTITVRDKRGRPGHMWTGPSSDCRECRNEAKRVWRRRKAEQLGKVFVPRGDRAAWEAQQRETRKRRQAAQMAQRQSAAEERRRARRAAAEERRRARASFSVLLCSQCMQARPRGDFYASDLGACKACIAKRDAAKFQRDRKLISDRYVRRQLTKHSGLRAADIPQAMIEAKRAQLLLERVVPTEAERYAIWLRGELGRGPVDAKSLNLAAAAGFSRSRIHDDDFRKVRRDVATYDRKTNTWSAR